MRLPLFSVFLSLFIYNALCQDGRQDGPQLLLNAENHSGKIRGLSFNKNGDQLISLSEDQSIRWWQMSDGTLSKKEFFTQKDAAFTPLDMAVNNDLGLIAVVGVNPGSSKHSLYLIDSESRQILSSIVVHTSAIRAVALSSNLELLASGDEEGNVQLWDISNRKKPTKLDQIEIPFGINDLSFSDQNKTIAVASDDKDIRIFDLSKRKLSNSLLISRHYLGVNCLSFSPDGKYLVSGGKDEMIYLFKSNGKFLRKIGQINSEVTSLSLSNDSKVLVALSKNEGIGYSYNIPNGQPLAQFDQHKNTTFACAFHPDSKNGNYLVASAGASANEILIWNAINGSLWMRLGNNNRTIKHLDIDKEGNLLISRNANSRQYEFKFDFKDLAVLGNPKELIDTKESASLKLVSPYMLKGPKKSFTNNPNTDGRILSYYSLGTDSMVVGSDFSLRISYAKTDQVQLLKGHSGGVRAITENEKFLITGGEDNLINFWLKGSDEKEIRPFASLFIDNPNEWILWTNGGYFTAAGNGAANFGWAKSTGDLTYPEFYTGNQFFSILFRPDEVKESLISGRPVTEILQANGTRIFALDKVQRPAAVLFESPFSIDEASRAFYLKKEDLNYISDRPKVKMAVKALDGGSGIQEIFLYQNSKLIKNDQDIPEHEQTIFKEYEVDLMPGKNAFKVVALNFQGIESRPDEISVKYTGEAAANADLYVLNIGINEYMNPSYNLNYAQPDAKAFREAIEKHSASIFSKTHIYSLYDEEAIKPNIIEIFDEIKRKSRPQDVFIFYYAGHGTVDLDGSSTDYYLVPYDITQIYGNTKILNERGISAAELRTELSEITAQKQLILLDACHSGGAVELFAMRGSPEEKAIIQLARSSGTVLLSASGTQQYAIEFDELGHGVFTYALLEGIKGKADGGNRDGKITVNELKAYMEDAVPTLSEQYGGSSQYPTGFSTGQDFPIGLINK